MEFYRLKFSMWNNLFLILFTSCLFAATGENSFTPEEIVFPIEKIQLSTELVGEDPAGEVLTIYECTSGDCMLKLFSDSRLDSDSLSDADDLAKLAINLQINDDPYRYLTIISCSGNTVTFNATLKGEVNISGTQYYTASDVGLKEDVDFTPESVTVEFAGCSMYYELQSDIQVIDSEVSPLTLFLDINDIASGHLGVAPYENGCGQYGTDPNIISICMGYPHMVPLQSTTSPTVQNYNIYRFGEADNTAGGRIVFYTDSSGSSILGGFSRFIFSDTSELPEYPYFYHSVQRVSQNDSGSYSFSTYGLFYNTTYLNFTDFPLNSHNGDPGTDRVYSTNNGTIYNYGALKESD